MRQVYLDHNATTPLDEEVCSVIHACLERNFANPSSVHRPGQEARHALEEARETLAAVIGAAPQEISFTSGATESNNLAIQGVARTLKAKGKMHLITSAFEHPSVLGPLRYLTEHQGFEVSHLPVSPDGMVDPAEVSKALRPDTGLLSLMHVNHEVGTVQPLQEITKILKDRDILFHVDASQSFGKLEFRVDAIGCDYASFSAHKIYGPKGIGALYVRHSRPVESVFYGGHQEKNARPGTENVAFAVGLARAASLMERRRSEDAERLSGLKRMLREGLRAGIPGIRLNGSEADTLYTTLNLAFDGVGGEPLMFNLDLKGIHVSTGQACTSGSLEPSHVLLAMGLSEARARSSVRFSLGHGTSEEDIHYCLEVIPSVVRFLRSETHCLR